MKKDRFYAKKPTPRFILEFRSYPLAADFPVIALLNGQFLFPKSRSLPNYMHFHNCMEIGYVFSGDTTLAMEDQTFPIHAGDLFLIPPYASHITFQGDGENRMDDPNIEYLYVDAVRLLEKVFPASIDRIRFFQHNSPEFPYVVHTGENERAASLLLEILQHMREKKECHQDCIRALALLLLTELEKSLPSVTSSENNSPQSRQVFRLSAAVEYINDHYMEHIPPKTLADLCFTSLTSFRRIFKNAVGLSPLEYIHHIRIRKAQILLFSTEESILDISLSVGFSSPSSFNRRFAEIVGMSPLKYRNYCRSIQKKNFVRSEFEL